MGRRGLRVWVDGDPSSELMVGFAARDFMCRSKAPPFRTDLGPPTCSDEDAHLPFYLR